MKAEIGLFGDGDGGLFRSLKAEIGLFGDGDGGFIMEAMRIMAIVVCLCVVEAGEVVWL